jgi:hypothetical protein
MFSTISNRAASVSAAVGGTLLAASGALQATGLDWTENAVKTPLQHVTMALFAGALVALVPAAAALARYADGRARLGWIGIAVGQTGVAVASTVSNARGVDASWFPAAAVAANGLWILGTLALAVALWRTHRVARPVAIGLVVAYIGSIPLGAVGGGIVAGAYWLAVSYLFSVDRTETPTVLAPQTL